MPLEVCKISHSMFAASYQVLRGTKSLATVPEIDNVARAEREVGWGTAGGCT